MKTNKLQLWRITRRILTSVSPAYITPLVKLLVLLGSKYLTRQDLPLLLILEPSMERLLPTMITCRLIRRFRLRAVSTKLKFK